MKTILFILLIIPVVVNSQEKVSISVMQDLKLATIGDKEHNYNAFTTDVILRFKMQGKQQKYGYLTIFPQFEYAELRPRYIRYSANVGYTLNQFKYIELMPYVGYGITDRKGSYKTISLGGEISYPIGRFKILANGEYLKRKELNKWVFSGYIGLEFVLN